MTDRQTHCRSKDRAMLCLARVKQMCTNVLPLLLSFYLTHFIMHTTGLGWDAS